MERRLCQNVIKQIMEIIPSEKTEFLSDLEWNFEDSCYKAPEENLQWERTMLTLQKHIPSPKKDWEFKVLSIFTTKPIEVLKESLNV